MIRVRTPSRLHFGLLTLPGGAMAWPDRDGQLTVPARGVGGVGLMVECPGLSVSVTPASHWAGAGLLGERALGYARQVSAALRLDRAFRVAVEVAPREHLRLGTRTQLALALARAITLA